MIADSEEWYALRGQRSRSRQARRAVSMAPVGFAVLADGAATADAFARFVDRSALADGTRRSYTTGARLFVAWLGQQRQHPALDVFTDPLARDFAVREWRGYLLNIRRLAPGTVDTRLTAVAALFTWLGLGPANVDRVEVDARAGEYGERLSPQQDRAIMRAAERRGARDLALVGLLRLNGLRSAEVRALNVDDFTLTARTGPLTVRGKGSKVRVVHMGARMREAMAAWQAERRTWPGADGPALFLSREGRRISDRSIRYLVSTIGATAGVDDLHPHRLRHAFSHAYLAGGGLLSELKDDLGHASLATTSLYVRPTAAERAASTERASVDW